MPEKIPSQSFEDKKTKFFSDFALRHRNELRFHKKYGALEKSEGWRRVSEHCLVEGVIADTLARELGLGNDERVVLVAAALLHDFYKRKELEAEKAKGTPGMEKEMENEAGILKERDVPDIVIRLKEAVEDSTAKYFIEGKANFPEKLMRYYIDAITQGSDVVSIDERFDYFEKRYPEVNEKAGTFPGGKTFFQVQREICREIEKEIAARLNIFDPNQLPAHTREKVFERINNE